MVVTTVSMQHHLRSRTPSGPTDERAILPSYTAFYRTEFGRMASLATTICGNYQQGEDVAQEAMTRAHRDWARVSAYDSPGAWVRRVTINLSLTSARRAKRERVALRRVADDARAQRDLTNSTSHPGPGVDHEVWEVVKTLPPRQRAVVALFYQEDLDTGSIAELLDCTVSTATSHLNQARQNLAARLSATEEDEEEEAR